MSAHLSELRSLLHRRPDAASWERLCRIMEEAPAHEVEQTLLPYAQPQLERWPPALRVMPKRWLAKVLSGQPAPQALTLTRALLMRGPRMEIKDARALLEAKLHTHISHLWLTNLSCEAETLEALFVRQDWPNLMSLDLTRSPLGESNIDALARAELMQRLQSLDLHLVGLKDQGLDRLSHGAAMAQLQELGLGANRISDLALERFFERQALPALMRLDLSNNPQLERALITMPARLRAQLRALKLGAGAPLTKRALLDPLTQGDWTGLEALTLSQSPIRAELITKLLQAPSLQQLRELALVMVSFTDELSFLEQPGAPLASLRLTRATLDMRALDALAGERWGSLKRLDLSGCVVDAQALLAWARRPMAASLEELNLASTGLDDEALNALARRSAGLKRLDLSNNPISDASMAQLASLPTMGSLLELKLGSTQVTDAGRRSLRSSPHLSPALKNGLI